MKETNVAYICVNSSEPDCAFMIDWHSRPLPRIMLSSNNFVLVSLIFPGFNFCTAVSIEIFKLFQLLDCSDKLK